MVGKGKETHSPHLSRVFFRLQSGAREQICNEKTRGGVFPHLFFFVGTLPVGGGDGVSPKWFFSCEQENGDVDARGSILCQLLFLTAEEGRRGEEDGRYIT